MYPTSKETHMARADKPTTQPQQDAAADDEARRQQPGAQGGGTEADAVKPDGNVDEKKLERNKERLGVGEDHKTEEMRKKHRGTFP
jgi:hypothetical protein